MRVLVSMTSALILATAPLVVLPMVVGMVVAMAMTSESANAAPAAERISIKGELVDTWCSVTGIMYAYGTAHYQCAIWCAAGGIPTSIKAEDGKTYMVLSVGDDSDNVSNPKIMAMQTHEVTVEGDHYERDGVNYILVDKVTNDEGIVNMTHEDYGIQPFGE